MLPEADLISLQRSAGMLRPGDSFPMAREDAIAVLTELLAARSLIRQLGGGLVDVAREAKRLQQGG